MPKVSVLYSDGVSRGAYIRPEVYRPIKYRTWEGPPHPHYEERLLEASAGVWYRCLLAKEPRLEGPEGDEYDPDSKVYMVTPAEAAAWLTRNSFSVPPTLAKLAASPSGKLLYSDEPSAHSPETHRRDFQILKEKEGSTPSGLKRPAHRPRQYDPVSDAKLISDLNASGMKLHEFAATKGIRADVLIRTRDRVKARIRRSAAKPRKPVKRN